MRHRGIAHDESGVVLRKRKHGAVQDRHHRDRDHQLLVVLRRVWQERQHDPQEAVHPDLREHAGEQRQHRDRRGPVGVGHPSVQRERGGLHQERGGEQQEDPLLRPLVEQPVLEHGQRERDVLPMRRREHAESHRAGEHQQRADQGVDDELGRRPNALPPAPGPDQEVERDQHQVEEDDEERQVLRAEGPDHGGLGESEVEEEQPRPLPVAERRRECRGHPEDRRERDQEEVEPVDAKRVTDAQLRHPLRVRHVLEAGAVRRVVGDHPDRQPEDGHRGREHDPSRPPARQEGRRQAGGKREEDGDGQRHRHDDTSRK